MFMSLLTQHLLERLEGKINEPTLSYVVQVLCSYGRSTTNDLSKESLVLAFLNAKTKVDFESFQKIGDWSLWLTSIFPSRNDDVIFTFGSMSYRQCHNIVKQWDVYDDLSRNMKSITKIVNNCLSSKV